MTDIDGDPDGDVEMTEREQVEGIEYDNRLENQYQATLFQQTDKRTQLEKLRDGYTKNIAKLNKEQLRSLFRDAQKAGMKETFTQCKNMNKQQAAVLQFYIKEFHANGVDIKKAPIFNPRKAKNDRPQKQRKRTRAQETTETTQAATAAKTSHKGNVDPYKTLGQFTWEYRQKHTLLLVGSGRKTRIRCAACDFIFSANATRWIVQQHCGEGCRAAEGPMKALHHKKAISEFGGRNEREEQYCRVFLANVPEQQHLKSEKEAMVYRMEKAQAYLKAGTKFSNFDHHQIVDKRHIDHGGPAGRTHMGEVIPAVIDLEVERIKSETGKDAKISVIFDGTTRIGDVQAIIFRFVLDDGKNPPEIIHRLVGLPNLESSLCGEALAGVIGRSLEKYDVPPENLLAASRDGCLVNTVCTNTLKGPIFNCKNLIDLLCHSHNAHNTGTALLDPPVAYDINQNKLPPRVTFPFIKKWNKCYVPTCVSHKAGLLFVDITGEKDTKGMGTVRWNAKFENLFQKHRIGWEHIRTWAVRMVDDGLCGRSAPNMSTMLNDQGQFLWLVVEVTFYIVICQPICELTTRCEGDGQLSPVTYDYIMDLVLTRFRSGYDWIWANDSLMDAIEALKDYQEAQPDDAIDVKIAAAKKVYEDALEKVRIGPTGDYKRKKKNVSHLDQYLRAAAQAKYAAERLIIEERLKKDSDSALDEYTKLMSQSTPSTVTEIKNKLISYSELAIKYFIDKYTTGPFKESLELFRLAKIVNPNFAKTCSQANGFKMIDDIFEHLPYLKNCSNKDQWMKNLKDSFSSLKAKHATLLMSDKLKIGDKVLVRCMNHPVPRAAEVMGVPMIHGDKISVKYKGQKKDESDLEEEDVLPGRVILPVRDFLKYFHEIRDEFPEWMELVKILVLLQPSSAAAERVFSQLAGMFSKSQMSLLQDTMWIVIALRFHDRDL